MTVVVDSSAAVVVTLGTGRAAELGAWLRKASIVAVPDLFVAEVANVFWKYVRFAQMDRERAHQGLTDALALVDEFVGMPELASEAFDLAATTGHPAYDTFYLALARRRGAILLTADKGLRKTAHRLGIRLEAQTGK